MESQNIEYKKTENVPFSLKISDKTTQKAREKTREKIIIRENNKITTHKLAEALSLTDKDGHLEVVGGSEK